jgi:hypothetical protein
MPQTVESTYLVEFNQESLMPDCIECLGDLKKSYVGFFCKCRIVSRIETALQVFLVSSVNLLSQ